MKTHKSRRDIPRHDDLIALGVLELVQSKDNYARLFPYLLKVVDCFAGIVSSTWRPLTKQ